MSLFTRAESLTEKFMIAFFIYTFVNTVVLNSQ